MKVCPVCGTQYDDEAAFCSRDRSALKAAEGSPRAGLLGQLVGERYQVERRLGEGGMGEVYLARHLLMGRLCALKVMSPALSKDPDAVARFNREATSASRISHPNVCAVYDFGLTDEGLVYLAMEYVEGSSLTALLDQTGPVPLRRTAALLTQCAAGLQAAHELGIVHRDLKPDNIMVRSTAERETAKLVDFGIAKAIASVPGERVTKSGLVIGTPEYMSPEQLSGDPVDGRSDQYSLALVCYRLLTGELPFQGTSLQETLVKRLTDPPRPLADSRPDLEFPAGMQAILDRALARNPADRYPSVVSFADAINTLLVADAVPTRPLESPAAGAGIPRTRQVAAKSRRGTPVAIGSVALLLIAGGAWAVLQKKGAQPNQGGADSASVAASPPAVLPPESSTSGTTAKKIHSAPPPTASPKPAVSTTIDTSQFDLGALDLPARRAAEIRRARQLLDMEGLSSRRRAEAAYFLGTAALDDRLRDSARKLFQLAYRLDSNQTYLKALQQFRDTIHP